MKLLKTVSRELAISAERSTVRQAEYRKVAKKHVEDARRVQVQDPTTLEPTAMKARMKLGAQFSWSCWLNQMECVPASIASRTRARSEILFHSEKSSAKQSRFTT
jgi:hypothetical protein